LHTGANVVATAFAELGFDVDIGPLFATPDEVVKSAIENDVDIIGLSSLAGGHLTLAPEIVKLLKAKNAGDITVIVGGVVSLSTKPNRFSLCPQSFHSR
jgi:methylmalonyl-CoA mutase